MHQDKSSKKPNVLVSGTPGTGKTTLSKTIAERLGLNHIELGALIKSKELHSGRDEEFDSFIVDEDKVCDELEDIMSSGGNVVDFHSCDFFPQRWFDLVLILRTDNEVLFPRLESRGYSQKKIEENIEAEIMQVLLDEAKESYHEEIVVELPSNTADDMLSNIDRITSWYNTHTTTANNNNKINS